jgi:hypothetical protein
MAGLARPEAATHVMSGQKKHERRRKRFLVFLVATIAVGLAATSLPAPIAGAIGDTDDAAHRALSANASERREGIERLLS